MGAFVEGNKNTILPHKATIPHITVRHNYASVMQRNHSIKDTLNKGHLSEEDTLSAVPTT